MIGKSPRPQSRSSAPMGKAPMAKSAAPVKSARPAPRPADLMANATLDRAMRGAAARERMDAEAGRMNKGKKFKDGGMVKGECKGTSGMVSGKKFSGTY